MKAHVLSFLIMLSTVFGAAGPSANAIDDSTADSLRALEILDQIMAEDCDDPLAYELRGDALANLGLVNESARSRRQAKRLELSGPTEQIAAKIKSVAAAKTSVPEPAINR